MVDTRKATRPSFTDAAAQDVAKLVYETFCEELPGLGIHVGASLGRGLDRNTYRRW